MPREVPHHLSPRALLRRGRGPHVGTVYLSGHHPAHRQALVSNGEACPCLFACQRHGCSPVCLIFSIPSKYLGHTCELTVRLPESGSGHPAVFPSWHSLVLLQLVQSHCCSLCQRQRGLRNPLSPLWHCPVLSQPCVQWVLRVPWRRAGVALPWGRLEEGRTCRNLQHFTLAHSGLVLPPSPVVCLWCQPRCPGGCPAAKLSLSPQSCHPSAAART